ncbi:MAG TPA: BON domain-containing protein [Dissulfurispiraceae bacterium]|nr:BON domain-containing protein [Dissulfurispiraceae bacterium]
MKRLLIAALTLCLCFSFMAGCASSGRTTGEVIDDAVIVSDINKKIIKDADLSYWKINVDSSQGNVTLTGTVRSQAAAEKAVGYANSTKGVKSVRNGLLIQTPK